MFMVTISFLSSLTVSNSSKSLVHSIPNIQLYLGFTRGALAK
jgi:hypothetical protein